MPDLSVEEISGGFQIVSIYVEAIANRLDSAKTQGNI